MFDMIKNQLTDKYKLNMLMLGKDFSSVFSSKSAHPLFYIYKPSLSIF